MRMPVRAGTQRRGSTRRNTLLIFFISASLARISAKPNVLSLDSSNATLGLDSNSTLVPNCGGTFRVGIAAKVISIPRAVNNTPVFCQWLLKAKDAQTTIALSVTDTALDFSVPKVRSRLETRDGWLTDSPLIGALETSQERLLTTRADFSIGFPMKATSGFMLIQFWNDGYDPIHIDFAYYTCGGQIDSSGTISSPTFKDLSLLPSIVSCDWRLEKPETAVYSYLRPLLLNITDCCSLQLRSNSSMRIIEHIALDGKQISNATDFFPDNFTADEDPAHISDSDNMSCLNAPFGTNMVTICGDSVRLVAFESQTANLNYLSLSPEKEIGFRITYGSFRVPNKLETHTTEIVWYLDYCALTIFTPIGAVLGAIIIFCQSRRKWPKRSSPILVTKLNKSEVNQEATPTCHFNREPCDGLEVSQSKLANKFQRQHSGRLNNERSLRKALLKSANKKALRREDSSVNTTDTAMTGLLKQPFSSGKESERLSSAEYIVDEIVECDAQSGDQTKAQKVRFDPTVLQKQHKTVCK